MPPVIYPPFRKYPAVKGLFLGGCVDRNLSCHNSSYRAHAHIDGEYSGWICCRSKKIPGRNLLLHELAHILTYSGHTRQWAEKLIELGGKIDRRYHKLKGVSQAFL